MCFLVTQLSTHFPNNGNVRLIFGSSQVVSCSTLFYYINIAISSVGPRWPIGPTVSILVGDCEVSKNSREDR